MSEHLIDLININKSFGKSKVLSDINLFIRKNEFVTLLGPSGCGKTTTLRIIGGFEKPTSGEVRFEGQVINDVPPHKRKVNTVFQKYALFTHLNVRDNVAFGLSIQKADKKTIDKTVGDLLELVNLAGFEKRSVSSLSGGQQQRVAIARALAVNPAVLLLDEPLGALDLKERRRMQLELKNMQRRLGITFIYVTHDQEEALAVSDIIVVMNEGVIQQINTPEGIYNEPQNAFVADFIGESNIIDAVMIADYKVSFSDVTFECLDKGFMQDEPVDVVIRPEDIVIHAEGRQAAQGADMPNAGMQKSGIQNIQNIGNNAGCIEGIVKDVKFTGSHNMMLIESCCDQFLWKAESTQMYETGSRVRMTITPYAIHVMKKTGVQV